MQAFNGDTRRFRQYTDPSQLGFNLRDIPEPSREPLVYGMIPGLENRSPPARVRTACSGPMTTPSPTTPTSSWTRRSVCSASRDEGNRRAGRDTRNLPHTPGCEIVPAAAMANKANPLSSEDFNPIIGGVGSGALPLRPAPNLLAGPRKGRGEVAQGVWLPNHEVAEMLRRDKFGSFDQNFTPGRAGVEPRRQPAGREGAEGALRRHRALRQPALAAGRQAEHRLGQDGAVPHHRPVQSPGSRPRLADGPGGVPDRPLGAAGGLVLLQRRASRGRSPRAGDELRRVRADRHRPLRRALRAASGLRQDLRSDGARVHQAARSRGRSGLRIPGTAGRGSRWAAVWSGATTASASPSPTSTATTTGPTWTRSSTTTATWIRSRAGLAGGWPRVPARTARRRAV